MEVVVANSPIVTIAQDTVFLRDGSAYGIEGITSGATNLVLMVNHAETDTIGLDPGLNNIGHQRADRLNYILSEVPISQIYMSHFRRTYLTGVPIIQARGTEVFRYEPDNLDLFAEILLGQREKISLVIGHNDAFPTLMTYLLDKKETGFTFTDHDYLVIAEMKQGVVHTLYKFKYLP